MVKEKDIKKDGILKRNVYIFVNVRAILTEIHTNISQTRKIVVKFTDQFQCFMIQLCLLI